MLFVVGIMGLAAKYLAAGSALAQMFCHFADRAGLFVRFGYFNFPDMRTFFFGYVLICHGSIIYNGCMHLQIKIWLDRIIL